jgi:hypothetical protein
MIFSVVLSVLPNLTCLCVRVVNPDAVWHEFCMTRDHEKAQNLDTFLHYLSIFIHERKQLG